MNTENKGLVKEKSMLILSMLIFSTIGVVRRHISLPSGFIAMVRGFSGALFLVLALVILRRKSKLFKNKKTVLSLAAVGTALGINWVLLFESYNHTSVAISTLCYYTAPVFYMFAGRLFFGERLTVKKLLCATAAAAGMALVSLEAVLSASGRGVTGIILGLAAALFYAASMVFNKKITGVEPFGKSATQLFVAAAVVLPYTLVFERVGAADLTLKNLLLLLTLGFIHTGLAYLIYFASLEKLPAHTAAILSYIDPVAALFLSWLVLHEKLTLSAVAGAVLIIGAAAVSEITIKRKN